MNVFDVSCQTAFAIAKEIAVGAMKLDGFCVNFVDMNFQLGFGDSFESAPVAKMFSRIFVNSFNVELQSLLASKTSPA